MQSCARRNRDFQRKPPHAVLGLVEPLGLIFPSRPQPARATPRTTIRGPLDGVFATHTGRRFRTTASMPAVPPRTASPKPWSRPTPTASSLSRPRTSSRKSITSRVVIVSVGCSPNKKKRDEARYLGRTWESLASQSHKSILLKTTTGRAPLSCATTSIWLNGDVRVD